MSRYNIRELCALAHEAWEHPRHLSLGDLPGLGWNDTARAQPASRFKERMCSRTSRIALSHSSIKGSASWLRIRRSRPNSNCMAVRVCDVPSCRSRAILRRSSGRKAPTAELELARTETAIHTRQFEPMGLHITNLF